MRVGAALIGYMPWHARDALLRAFTPLVLFAGMGGIPLWSFARSVGRGAMDRPGDAQELALQIYGSTMPLAMTLGAVVLATGIPATDREKQYFRFLFARPVVAWAYYLQQFLVGLALFVGVMTLVPVGFSTIITAVPVPAVALSALVFGLLYGSLMALCGALVSKDGIAFVAVAATSLMLQTLAKADALPGWLAQVAGLLPPFMVADAVRAAWLGGQPVTTGDIAHVIGYSVGMLAAALFLVRRLPLARS